MRFSSVVYTFEALKPSFSRAFRVNLIMIGGPQSTAMVLSGDGATFSSTEGTNPT